MKIEIDQSGKVEQTAYDTVIADSVGNYIVVKARTKRNIQTSYREIQKTQMFILEVFSCLVALLITKSYKREHLYIIDVEYYGRSDEIKRLLLLDLIKLGCKISSSQIQFGFVGKQSRAHQTAFYHFKNSHKTKQISLKKLLRLLGIKKGSRFL